MKKRLLILMTLGIMGTSLLTACGANKAADTQAPATANTQTPAESSDTQPPAEAPDTQTSAETLSEFEGTLEVDLDEAVQRVYDTVQNFGNGMMIEIFVPDVNAIYDNWDKVEAMNTKDKPIRLREYAETNIVYLDFDNGYSVKWDMVNDQAFANAEETNEADVKDWEGRAPK